MVRMVVAVEQSARDGRRSCKRQCVSPSHLLPAADMAPLESRCSRAQYERNATAAAMVARSHGREEGKKRRAQGSGEMNGIRGG